MKNKIGIVVLCMFCQFVMGQTFSRKPLHGQVVNDSVALESGYVLNVNTHTRTFISPSGLFDILARPKDTLLFSSSAFLSKKIVLTEKNCAEFLFLVQLDLVNNQLKEVIVGKELKVKAFQANSQRIVDTQFEDDKQSTAKNIAMMSDQTIKYGMDFVRIFKDVKKLLRKKDEVKEEEITDVAFIEYAKLNFTSDFYNKTLNLKPDEIELFLLYCSNDAESKKYLKPDDQFLLMDFLIKKNQEFKKVTIAEK
ncbi:hypothetical protein GON26_12955 [Flavobacterium sp. GA093]|uniref:CarboxypepD_reg-like domain-containing protein n=1 Tax=Flavobacterium hydrocarbonoxydans TaxID=2683249 RepID=A0A6I4NQK9_9FLAO|nr:hypothetical protein [Flavobacterium hydrocarbonoxydans]MWB95272.1 hypothetical protein [Flavobacterium hydrocarbonoxydans]